MLINELDILRGAEKILTEFKNIIIEKVSEKTERGKQNTEKQL